MNATTFVNNCLEYNNNVKRFEFVDQNYSKLTNINCNDIVYVLQNFYTTDYKLRVLTLLISKLSNLSWNNLVYVLQNFSNNEYKLKVLTLLTSKTFGLTFNDLVYVLQNFSNNDYKYNVLKYLASEVKTLTCSDLVYTMQNFSNNDFKYNVLTYFNSRLNILTYGDLIYIIQNFSNNEYKLNVLKYLNSRLGELTCSDLVYVMQNFSNNAYKLIVLELLKCKMINESDMSDNIIQIMNTFSNNDYKINAIKLFGDKISNSDIVHFYASGVITDISKLLKIDNTIDLIKIINTLDKDDQKVKLIKMYENKIDESILSEILLEFKSNNTKFDMIKYFVTKITKLRNILICISDNDKESDKIRIQIIKYLSEKIRNPSYYYVLTCDCFDLFGTEDGRIAAIKYLVYNSLACKKEYVCRTLNIFDSQNGKYKFLKKVVDLSKDVVAEIIFDLANKWDDKFNVRVAKLLIPNMPRLKLNSKFFRDYLKLFPKSDRLQIANCYYHNSVNNQRDVIRWLPLLESVDNANYLLNSGNPKKFTSKEIRRILRKSGYDAKEISKNKIEIESSSSESESESDEMEVPALAKTMRFNVSDLSLDGLALQYLNLVLSGNIVVYNSELDMITNLGGRCTGYFNLSGIDVCSHVSDQLLKSARQRYNSIKELDTKKNDLYVPHAWRDIKVKDDDDNQCVVCMSRRKQILFDCGHYHTCAKCSRQIVKGNRQCPMCRKTIIRVTRVFD